MERLLSMDVDQYVLQMRVEMECALRQVAEAVNNAETGNVINGSEIQVRDVMRQLGNKAYEKAVQMRIDSTESSFSPSEGLQRKTAGKQGIGRLQYQYGQWPD